MPDRQYGVEMTDDEIAAFLTRRGHGVLSFGGDRPYSLPISFGFDVLENRCIFQLVFHEGSEKLARLEASDRVSLVSYEWNSPDDWRSVVIEGRLARIESGSADAIAASEVFAQYASLAGFAVFDRPVSELDPEWFELDIEEMQGRHAPSID
ncbi:MAG: pyridoxamine 5'-phosphate oxidase family protein [Haloquadratum sp.]